MSDVAGKLVLVTGGSRGIGAEISRTLGKKGATVVVASRGLAACEAVAEEIRGAGGKAYALELDVSSGESVRTGLAAAAAMLDLRAFDGLVNNAGIAESAPLVDPERDLYRRHLEVNFHGPRRLVEALLPGMRERGFGRIVNVASSAGLRGYAYVAAYCASKFALVGYTLSAAAELAKTGVTVNAVCPHYVESPMLEASITNLVEKTDMDAEAARRFFEKENPGGRLVQPDTVARHVLRLLEGEENGLLVELDGSTHPKKHRPNGKAKA